MSEMYKIQRYVGGIFCSQEEIRVMICERSIVGSVNRKRKIMREVNSLRNVAASGF